MDLILVDGTEVFVVPNKICCISPYFYKRWFGKKKCGTAVLLDNGKFVLVQNDYSEICKMLQFYGDTGVCICKRSRHLGDEK